MENEYRHTPESDLDKTDRLPVLAGTLVDRDVADDAVPLDQTDVLAAGAPLPGLASGSLRAAGVEPPSFAERARSVEARIARQDGEYDALTRTYERARQAESASTERANALAVDLAAARTALEAEQGRSRELERTLAERSSALEAARPRAEEAVRAAERYQTDSRTLRDSLGSREATIVQLTHSLAERDAQLSALQQEHARVVPALQASSKSTAQLQADLQASRADASALGAELTATREKVTTLVEQLKRSEAEINATRYELGAAKIQASNYLDLLRTREWRQGFDQNLLRELDAKANAIHASQSEIESERAERTRLTAELAARDRALAEARQTGTGDAREATELRAAAELKDSQQATQMAVLRAEHAAQIKQLQSEAQTHEQEMTVLMAHLHEARQPRQAPEAGVQVSAADVRASETDVRATEADVKRLTDALAAKVAAVAQLEEEDRKLRAALERTRAELEEREFFIRRLELSDSNNANALGRIQTNVERMGSIHVEPSANAAVVPELSAELIKIDGAGPSTYVLSKRTRIGRADGCELQIDSSSVSRHHALVVVGLRDTVIEDLNSTNGVFVNGRKVVRQLLADGDAVTIGESKFRYCTKPLQEPPQADAAARPPRE